jgi:hypothetical protein
VGKALVVMGVETQPAGLGPAEVVTLGVYELPPRSAPASVTSLAVARQPGRALRAILGELSPAWVLHGHDQFTGVPCWRHQGTGALRVAGDRPADAPPCAEEAGEPDDCPCTDEAGDGPPADEVLALARRFRGFGLDPAAAVDAALRLFELGH